MRQRERPLEEPGDAAVTGRRGEDAPVEGTDLLERVLEAGHLRRALQQVRRNQGALGGDGRTVDDLGAYGKTHGPTIRAALLEGTDVPQPVRRTAIPKAGGGTRKVGIPTVLDRFIEHVLRQGLQEAWDPTVSERSYGFRPQRRAHQAVGQAQAYIRAGDTGGGGHRPGAIVRPGAPRRLAEPGTPTGAGPAGASPDPLVPEGGSAEASGEPTVEGTPQGGPRSPLLAHLRLAALDKELEKRGHRFARDADAAHIDGRRRPAGARVMASVRRLLERKLRLKGNETMSAVDRPWNRTFLGCTFTRRPSPRRQVSEKALKAFTAQVGGLTGRMRGRTIRQIGQELRQLMWGGREFFGFAEVGSPLRDLDTWGRRRRRSYHWQQGGRRGARALRQGGVGRQWAWTTAKSAHGPWRLSQRPALGIALPQRYVAALGLPSLCED